MCSAMPPIVYTSKADMVTSALREMIITGALKPGEHLRQRDLAVQFGVSPTPVREALRRLESEGLVSDQQHRGSSVVERGFGDTQENYEIRAMLEPMASRLAAGKITGEQIAELRSINERLANTLVGAPEFGRLNYEFHLEIGAVAASPLLLSLIRLLWQAFPQGPQVRGPRQKSIGEHARLIDALEQGNGELAAEITRAHILGAGVAVATG
jgi:DNA-binding GntR family transcriptional regulator